MNDVMIGYSLLKNERKADSICDFIYKTSILNSNQTGFWPHISI